MQLFSLPPPQSVQGVVMSIAQTIDSLAVAHDVALARLAETARNLVLLGRPDAQRARACDTAKADLASLHSVVGSLAATTIEDLKAKARLAKRFFGDSPSHHMVENADECDAGLIASIFRDVIALAA